MSRLEQLRALVARLERLPESPRQEWMLEEARARIVDVETGFASEPMRPLDGDRRAPAGGPQRSKGAPPVPRKRPAPVRAEEPRAAPAPEPDAPATGADPSPQGGDALVATDQLLSLEDSAPTEGAGPLPPWRRGLRG